MAGFLRLISLLLYEYNYNMIMKYLISLLILITASVCFAAEVQLRDYSEFDIPAGFHLPVISLQEFSTAYCEEGDNVNFEITSDIYLYNKNVIPKGTKLTGYIDKKNEPIIGTNAAMKVFVNKMYLPDGYEIPIKSYIYTANNNLIGGELTPPATYIKMPHYQRWVMFRAFSTTQYVPGNKRRMGEHVTISSGANLIIVLMEPIHLNHIMLND